MHQQRERERVFAAIRADALLEQGGMESRRG
jgi:hypothetical protein